MNKKPNSREAIVDTASRLFFTQGYHGTGLNQIVKDSDSPKGSLYYYFPEGKEELASCCIHRSGEFVSGILRDTLSGASDAASGLAAFIRGMAEDAKQSSFEVLRPFSFWVAAETSCVSEQLRSDCQVAFGDWQRLIADRLIIEGEEEQTALDKASAAISLFEGALLQALTFRNERPLLAAAELVGKVLA